MNVVLEVLLEPKTVEGGWSDAIYGEEGWGGNYLSLKMSCLVILIAQYILAEGPLIFLFLQYLEIWSFLTLQARADCDEAHSKHQKKRWFTILRIQCGQTNAH